MIMRTYTQHEVVLC